MSWFTYDNIKSNRHKKGVRLRYHSNPKLKKIIKKHRCKRLLDFVERVIVCESKENNQVLLEVWCLNLKDSLLKKHRHNVFYVIIDENPKWVCEGDLGRGLVEPKNEQRTRI